jgi:hypothetical protein
LPQFGDPLRTDEVGEPLDGLRTEVNFVQAALLALASS